MSLRFGQVALEELREDIAEGQVLITQQGNMLVGVGFNIVSCLGGIGGRGEKGVKESGYGDKFAVHRLAVDHGLQG